MCAQLVSINIIKLKSYIDMQSSVETSWLIHEFQFSCRQQFQQLLWLKFPLVTSNGNKLSSLFFSGFSRHSRRNGFAFSPSTLFSKLRRQSSVKHFPYIYYKSFLAWFSVFLPSLPRIAVSAIRIGTFPTWTNSNK